MFYSHHLLSKKGPLGTIWVAAHSHKRLKKEDISQTNISSSVDKILLDEVPVVTYRILGYLLLGVVRIYSKKVEYLFRDCHEVLSEVRHFITSKKSDAGIEVMCAPYSSITVPERFELDAFDLEIIENLNRDHIKMQDEITLKGKKDGICSPSFHQSYFEEDTSHLGGYSAVHTTCNDIYSMSTMTAEMVASTSENLRNLERSMDKFRSNRFSLEDCLPPMLFDEAEERADPGRTFYEDSQTDGVEMNFPNSHIMSGVGGRPGDHIESLDEEHADLAQTEFSKLAGLQNEKIQIISPKCPVSVSIPIHTTPESKVPNSRIMSGDGGRPGADVESLDEEHADFAQKEFSKLTGLQNEKIRIISPICPVSVSIPIHTTPESKVPNSPGARTPGFMAVRTPATKEGARTPGFMAVRTIATEEGACVSKKRKCLYDANIIVIPNKVYKAGLDDPSDLVKKRRTAVRNANQKSEKIFFEPLIPGVSINFRSLLHEKEQESPEKIETTNTPTRTHNIGSLTSEGTHGEDLIAPSTPVTISISQRYNNTCGVTNSERLGCARSFASVDRELSAIGDPQFDVSSMSFASVDRELSPVGDPDCVESSMTKEEEMNLCEGDDKQEKHHWSTRTRAARFLYREFLTRKKRGTDEVVKFSQVVKGKSKKSNARLFYELLELTTRGFLNVKQDNPYDDISIVETSKLKQPSGVDNMV